MGTGSDDWPVPVVLVQFIKVWPQLTTGTAGVTLLFVHWESI